MFEKVDSAMNVSTFSSNLNKQTNSRQSVKQTLPNLLYCTQTETNSFPSIAETNLHYIYHLHYSDTPKHVSMLGQNRETNNSALPEITSISFSAPAEYQSAVRTHMTACLSSAVRGNKSADLFKVPVLREILSVTI